METWEKVPNYTMLRLMIVSANSIKEKFPEMDQMPTGTICPGYDIELM